MAARGSALVVLLLAVACSSEGTSPEEAAPSASPGGGGGAPSGGVIPSAGAGSGAEVGAGGLMFSGSGGTGSATPPPGVARSNMPLAEGWRFLRQDAANAQDPAFDDAAWESVTVPHTYNALDGQDGGGDYYRGPTWYRLRFTAPELAGRRAYLGFDAANTVADVYLNGTSLGQHRGGYSAFRFDATAALVTGDNVLAVKVDNASVPDVAPLQADFTFFGGLYRDVSLTLVDPLHVDLEDFASSGVYVSAPSVSATAAELTVRVRVKNAAAASETPAVDVVVLDAQGNEVARASGGAEVGAGQTSDVVLSTTLPNPHLWDGRRDPYLYTARVELRRGDTLVDVVMQPFGVRTFAFDANTGFSLNGRPYDLYGVNRHQDRIDKGWAIGTAEHDEDLAHILELGASAVRLAHYQHAQYFYDLCDRAGLVVWAEIPLVDAITASPVFTANARQQLTELIRQSYNHPSIVVWGIGNEQRTDDAATNALLAELAALVTAEDASRPSTYAHCCLGDTSPVTQHGDLLGYNYYYGWYMGSFDQVGAWSDALHAAQPNLRFSMSEYGAGASVLQHQDPPQQPATTAPFHPEEYQTVLHEATWQQLAARPYIWGKFIWNMFDFASDGRNEGDTPGRNDKGIVTYDRRTKKDAFYWYKANWSQEPLVHITSRRFEPRTTATIDIKVYSNLPNVTLNVNGSALPPQSSQNHIFRWTSVPLVLGANQVQATASDGANRSASDNVTWTRQ